MTTLVCAPIVAWPKETPVDLYEKTDGGVKYLYNKDGTLVFVDRTWEDAQTGDIVSYHNRQETPDLEEMLAKMRGRHPRARYYKLATFARSTLDALRMLHLQRKYSDVIGVAMGSYGTVTRIVAPAMGAPITYAPLTEEEKNSPGQLLWKELDRVYRFRERKVGEPLFGLIGDPVGHSLGHLFHNERFLYVKMEVKADELGEFFRLIDELPFRGLSVTAPLKEAVIPHLTALADEAKGMGAVNTITQEPGGWKGWNTDGVGAADVLGDVAGKRVVIVGAGGAARAISYELTKRLAQVTIVNRTRERGERVAREIGCAFSETVIACDILINTTPACDFPALAPLVMDITYRKSLFLEKARKSGATVLNGLEMFCNQAMLQQRLFTAAAAQLV